jgi:hypothetical protein
VRVPGAADFIDMGFYQSLRHPKATRAHANILRRFYARLNPEFGFAIGALNVDMHSSFFAGEEIEAVTIFAEYRRTHRSIVEIDPNES